MTATTRSMFFHQIQGLRDDVVTLASMVDQAIARASETLRSQDVTLAKRELVAQGLQIHALGLQQLQSHNNSVIPLHNWPARTKVPFSGREHWLCD